MHTQEVERTSLDWVNDLPQSTIEEVMNLISGPVLAQSSKKIELTEEELVANFFLGLFPDINDPEDLSIEISTFLEDLQVHARAKKNQQMVDFCNFFADNADQLAEDLLAAKEIIAQKVRAAYEQESENAEKIDEVFEKSGEISPRDQIREARTRFSNGTGVFRFHSDVDQDYEYEFIRDGGNNVERNQEDDHQE